MTAVAPPVDFGRRGVYFKIMHDRLPVLRLGAVFVGLGLLWGCTATRDEVQPQAPPDMRGPDARAEAPPPDAAIRDAAMRDAGPTPIGAHVTAVSVAGSAGAHTLSVTLQSPDTGCAQYANWWEVLDAEGGLLYRRILGHSHVDEQPFTRSGGPVDAQPDQVIWVRAHMHPSGYGGTLMRGTTSGGFVIAAQPPGWPNVEALPPQPTGCAF